MPSKLGFLHRSIPIEPLITFRVLFGLLMFISTARFMGLGWIDDQWLNTLFQFKYYGFGWVERLPRTWMYGLYIGMLLSSLGILLGACYRMSALYFFLAFTYTELLDKTYYLNHYYLVSCLSFLMIFMPANRLFSVDVWTGWVKSARRLPAILIYILIFQIAIVYVYAGLAKLHPHWWMDAMPMRIWLPAQSHWPWIGSWLSLPWVAYAMSWGGLLFDLSFPFWFFTRWWKSAYLVSVLFHGLTGLFFQIGVFPLIMLGSSPLFFPSVWHQKLWRWISSKWDSLKIQLSSSNNCLNGLSNWKLGLIYCFVSFQLLFPWRYVFYPGDVFWTEQGYRFGWRVMLMEKSGTATFFVKNGESGREGEVFNREFLNAHQEKQMSMQADMIQEFAHFLKDYYQKQGMKDPRVRAEVYVTLNGAPGRLLINPRVDLAALPISWKHKAWILPNHENSPLTVTHHHP